MQTFSPLVNPIADDNKGGIELKSYMYYSKLASNYENYSILHK